MSDLKPVSRPSFLLDGRGGLVLVVVGLALVVAFLKPWGSNGTSEVAPSLAVVATPSPTPSPPRTPDPLDTTTRPYDPLIFGDHELRATWGLWPAGYMVSFGFAMNMEPPSPPSPTGGTPSSKPSGSAGLDSPIWPEAIDIPLGNHLLLIGVDTPIGYSVDDIHLVEYRADGGTVPVRVVLPPSPWPSHFTVIGIDAGYRPDTNGLLDPGPLSPRPRYRPRRDRALDRDPRGRHPAGQSVAIERTDRRPVTSWI